MLRELFETLLTPASREAQRLGLVHEQVAFAARARRLAAAWAPHREAARAAVWRVAETTPGQELAVVLGAGILLEIPLEALVARYRRVVLVDVVLSRAVRAAQRHHPGVEAVAMDLSGLLPALQPGVDRLVPPSPAPLPPEAGEADLVVSANLLSQLAIVPRRFLDQHGVAWEAQDAVARALIDAHLAALACCSGTVCLITDFEREERPTTGEEGATRYDILYGARPRIEGSRWLWDLAPPGEEDRTLQVRHRVMGGLFINPQGEESV
ncbi:hypothetical protein [Pararhodospirillum photometricum]|nr:hypothetical protein [Pararhodospirillum photometricum]